MPGVGRERGARDRQASRRLRSGQTFMTGLEEHKPVMTGFGDHRTVRTSLKEHKTFMTGFGDHKTVTNGLGDLKTVMTG